jgi:hypothetical protein
MANHQPHPPGLAIASSSKHPAGTAPSTRHAHRYRRRRADHSHPSSSALAALATFAASATATNGLPLASFTAPPPFLCPFIETVTQQYPPTSTATPRQAPVSPEPTPSSSCQRSHPAEDWHPHHPHGEESPTTTVSPRDFSVPDHWTEGSDGLWHRTDDWELYGSSHCGVSVCVRRSLFMESDMITELSDCHCHPRVCYRRRRQSNAPFTRRYSLRKNRLRYHAQGMDYEQL